MNRPTILIVDDEPIVTQMLSMLLQLSLPVQVITSNSPLHSLELLQQNEISLLLTDYLMPDLNGISLIRALRQKGSGIPVILLTGYCDEPELSAQAASLSPFEIMVKPWSNEELMGRIRTLLELPPSA